MVDFDRMLGGIDGGRVLDVAAQVGSFVQILMENLRGYTEILGIDTDKHAIQTAQSAMGREGVRWVMNAEQLGFEDESFDAVSISASLHHLQNIPRVVTEVNRVLKPGGHLILAEMHRDGQTEAQLTSVYLHQWVAEVDTALGHLHNGTLARQELLDHVAGLAFSRVEAHDFVDTDSDPMDRGRIEQLEGLIERVIQRAEGASSYPEIEVRGEELRRRLHQVGAQREPILVVIGEK